MERKVYRTLQGDSREQVRKCLSCERPYCTNCLSYKHRPGARPYSPRRAIFLTPEELEQYTMGRISVRELAERKNCSEPTIYDRLRQARDERRAAFESKRDP